MRAEFHCDIPKGPHDEQGATYVCGDGEVWISDGSGDATCLTGDSAGEQRMLSDIEPPLCRVTARVVVLEVVS